LPRPGPRVPPGGRAGAGGARAARWYRERRDRPGLGPRSAATSTGAGGVCRSAAVRRQAAHRVGGDPGGGGVTQVSVLLRLEAMEEMRAVPLTAFRHRHLSDQPLVVIPLTVAGEAGAPLAAMAGTSRGRPHLVVVAQPRNRNHRIAFASDLG